MTIGTLRPPNCDLLSDNVIGSVMQRNKPADICFDKTFLDNTTTASDSTTHESPQATARRSGLTRTLYSSYTLDTAEPIEKKRKRDLPYQRVSVLPAKRRSNTTSNVATNSVDRRAPQTEDASSPESEAKYQRELRRMRQCRYRTKQRNLIATLEQETEQLRQDVEELQQRHLLMSASVPTQNNVWSVAVEYFRVFGQGQKQWTQEPSTTESTNPMEFLRTTMSPDVVFNAVQGIDKIAQNWKQLSLWFHDTRVELEEMTKGPNHSVIAVSTTSLTITKQTLRNVFPHLHGYKCRARAHLAEKLLGKRIVVRGTTRFGWNSSNGRVDSVMSQADLFTPLMQLQETLEDVSIVSEKSLLSMDFQWNFDASNE